MAENKSTGITSDIYLELLEFGRERGLEGVTFKQALEIAIKQGYIPDTGNQEDDPSSRAKLQHWTNYTMNRLNITVMTPAS